MRICLKDDPARAIFPMTDCLPTNIGCEDMFSQGTCFCPFCGNQKVFAVPTFATGTAWSSPDWVHTYHTLQNSEAFPWRTSEPWHKPDCTHDDVTVHVPRFGPWALLLLRPHDRQFYPLLQDMAIPLTDTSIEQDNLTSKAFSVLTSVEIMVGMTGLRNRLAMVLCLFMTRSKDFNS